jgi:hypothetical protein
VDDSVRGGRFSFSFLLPPLEREADRRAGRGGVLTRIICIERADDGTAGDGAEGLS